MLDAKGIKNVYFGKYTRVDGTVIDGVGLDELAALKNSTLNTKLTERLATTKTLTEAIQPPFDQEIISTDGRARVLAAIESLQIQADVIVEVATSMDIHLEL